MSERKQGVNEFFPSDIERRLEMAQPIVAEGVGEVLLAFKAYAPGTRNYLCVAACIIMREGKITRRALSFGDNFNVATSGLGRDIHRLYRTYYEQRQASRKR